MRPAVRMSSEVVKLFGSWPHVPVFEFCCADGSRDPLACPALVSDARAKDAINRVQKLSGPYNTTIVNKGWYAEVVF